MTQDCRAWAQANANTVIDGFFLKIPIRERKFSSLNSASSILAFLANVAVVFIMSPIIVRQLGNTGYGIWDLILSFCGYLGLLEVGLGPAIIRFVAKSTSLEEHQETQRIFVTSAAALSLVGLASLVMMLIISLDPHSIFGTSPRRART